MLVHLIGSRDGVDRNFDRLRYLVEVIQKEGHTLAHNWVDDAALHEAESQKDKNQEDTDWSLHYKDSVEAISRADVVVAETSTPSFNVGYQVAMAINMKKPTLVLNREGVEKSFFASGIDAGIVYRKYTEDSVEAILAKFLEENDIGTKDMRFNFFIDRPIYNYLRWSALKTGKTKAEILRELVQREIENKENY